MDKTITEEKQHCSFTKREANNYIKLNIKNLKADETINYFNYFKQYIDQGGVIDNKNLCNLFKNLHQGLNNIVDFHENKLASLTTFFDLMQRIAERGRTQRFKLVHDWTMLLAQGGDALENLFKKTASYPNDDLSAVLIRFLATLQGGITNRDILIHGHPQINMMLDSVAKTCILQSKCDLVSVLDKSFFIWGSMGRELEAIHWSHYAYVASIVPNHIISLKKAAEKRLLPEEIGPLLRTFFNQRYLGKEGDFIIEKYQEYFPSLKGGLVGTSARLNSSKTFAFNQTDLLSTPACDDEFVASTQLINLDDNSTVISSNASWAEGNNQTTTALSSPFSYTDPMLSRAFSALGLGVFSGCLDEASQSLLHIVERKGCSPHSRRFLAVTLAVANSFAIATFPLMDSLVRALVNEEDPILNSHQLLISSFAFLTALVLQGTKYGLNYLSHNYLDHQPIIRFFVNFLPFWGGLWLFANGEEGFFENFASVGLHILGAVFSKVAIAGIQSRSFAFWRPRTNYQSYGIELTLLQESPVSSSAEQSQKGFSDAQGSKKVISLPNPSQVCYFIKPGKFDDLKCMVNEVSELLPRIAEDLSREDRENFQPIIPLFNRQKDLLDEEQHVEACKQFPDAKSLVNEEHVTRLLSLFCMFKRNLEDNVLPKIYGVQGLRVANGEKLAIGCSNEALERADVYNKCRHAATTIRSIQGIIKDVLGCYDTKVRGVEAEKKIIGKEADRLPSLRDNRNGSRRPKTLIFPSNGYEDKLDYLDEIVPLSPRPVFIP